MEHKDTISYDDFARLELRIATIIAAEAHPNADRLLKLQVDLGDEQRQICAGIRQFAEAQDLVGQQVVMLVNLEPRTIRGEPSNGMLLAASVMEDGRLQDVVLLGPRKTVPDGASVS